MIKKTKNGYQVYNNKGLPITEDNLTLIEAKNDYGCWKISKEK